MGNDNVGRGAVQPGGVVARQDDKARFYAFSGRTEDDVSSAVITGTILICDQMAIVLFDTYSYVSVQFTLGVEVNCDMLDVLIHVSTQLGSLLQSPISIMFVMFYFWVSILGANLVILDITNFNVILGMT